jgi:hypothetical protein
MGRSRHSTPWAETGLSLQLRANLAAKLKADAQSDAEPPISLHCRKSHAIHKQAFIKGTEVLARGGRLNFFHARLKKEHLFSMPSAGEHLDVL